VGTGSIEVVGSSSLLHFAGRLRISQPLRLGLISCQHSRLTASHQMRPLSTPSASRFSLTVVGRNAGG